MLCYGTPYTKYRLTGDETYLIESMSEILEQIRYNTPLVTSEVIHTDRVYVSTGGDRGVEQLDAMLSGSQAQESSSPYNAVSWEKAGDDVTILVAEAGFDRLTVHLYSFSSEPTSLIMRIWQLKSGPYTFEYAVKGSEPRRLQVSVNDRGQRMAIQLPPQQLLTVTLKAHSGETK
jgi:hypothetical protein